MSKTENTPDIHDITKSSLGCGCLLFLIPFIIMLFLCVIAAIIPAFEDTGFFKTLTDFLGVIAVIGLLIVVLVLVIIFAIFS